MPPGVRQPPTPDSERPEWYRRALTLRRVPIILVVVVAGVLLFTGHGPPPPALETSCTTPAFALSTYNTPAHKTVGWSVTGPAGSRFALAIGVARFTTGTDGRLSPVPDPGVAVRSMRSTPPTTIDRDCKAHGDFGVALPAGTYSVRLFIINVSDTKPTRMEQVAEKKLVVTD